MSDQRAANIRDIRGDVKTEAEGLLNQAAGAVQDAYNKTVDAAAEGAQTAKEAAIASHDYLRKFVENNPHTAAAIALGMGLLIGYMSRRPQPTRRWWE
jgi:ElaB/YqjD/DUF883 family membrane-anchored ribosome-binding protein